MINSVGPTDIHAWNKNSAASSLLSMSISAGSLIWISVRPLIRLLVLICFPFWHLMTHLKSCRCCQWFYHHKGRYLSSCCRERCWSGCPQYHPSQFAFFQTRDGIHQRQYQGFWWEWLSYLSRALAKAAHRTPFFCRCSLRSSRSPLSLDHQAIFLGSPPFSIWNLGSWRLGKRGGCVYVFLHKIFFPTFRSLIVLFSAATAVLLSLTGNAPFQGTQDQNLAVAYISIFILVFTVSSFLTSVSSANGFSLLFIQW